MGLLILSDGRATKLYGWFFKLKTYKQITTNKDTQI